MKVKYFKMLFLNIVTDFLKTLYFYELIYPINIGTFSEQIYSCSQLCSINFNINTELIEHIYSNTFSNNIVSWDPSQQTIDYINIIN